MESSARADNRRFARYSTGALNGLSTAHDLSFPSPLVGIDDQDYLVGAWHKFVTGFDDLLDRSRDKLRVYFSRWLV